MSRLTLLHINIIGVVVAIIVAVGMYYVLITPARDQIAAAEKDQGEVFAQADQLPGNKKKRDDAIKAKQQAEADYGRFESQYMPVIGYQPTRMQTMIRTFWPNRGRSWPERFIRTFRGHMSRESKLNRITWLNPGVLQLGPYGPDPNAINAGMGQGDGLGESGALHYAFQMQVRAPSLGALMRHVRDWNTVRGMGVPVVEGLSVTGNSPNLEATYTVALTIIVHETFPKPDPRVGGAASSSGGGGAMGMRGPMGMGGPMGMSGPPMGMSGGPMGMAGPMSMGGAPMPPGGGPMSMGGATMGAGGGGSMGGGRRAGGAAAE